MNEEETMKLYKEKLDKALAVTSKNANYSTKKYI